SGKAGQSLRDHLSDVIRNRRINALVQDLALDAGPDDLALQPWDRDAIHQVFDGLEFRVLRDRLFATLSTDEPEATEVLQVEGVRLEPGTIRAWLEQHASPGARVGVVVQGTWGRGTGDVDAIALADTDGAAAWFESSSLTP